MGVIVDYKDVEIERSGKNVLKGVTFSLSKMNSSILWVESGAAKAA